VQLQLSGDTFVVASGFATGKDPVTDIVDLAFEIRKETEKILDKNCAAMQVRKLYVYLHNAPCTSL